MSPRRRLLHGVLLAALGAGAAAACGIGQIGPGGQNTSAPGSNASSSGSVAAPNAGGTASSGSADASGPTSAGSTAAASSAPAAGGARPAFCTTSSVGVPAYQMVRRLSQDEYNASLVDVFGQDPTSWQDIQFVGDLKQANQYDTYSDALLVNQPWLAALVDATFSTAQSLLAGPTASQLFDPSCNQMAIDATCVQAMVQNYGYRLFRRPLTTAEVSSYVTLFSQGVSMVQLSPSDALAGTLAALMQSPNTLYIQELGQPDGATFKLGGYELASILSYGLTGSTPSKALLDSVGTGALDTPAGLVAASQAMMQSPAGQAHLSKFFVEWTAYDTVPYAVKDPTVYTLPSDIQTAMVTETQSLIENINQTGGGLADLLQSPTTFVNLSLAQYYGWSTTGLTDAQFTSVQRPAGQGVGMLSQGGFLTIHGTPNSSSPTQRGLFVLESLLCGQVPPPPPNIPVIPAPSGNVTTRERYEDQHAVGSCQACHGQMDPIGFGLENFDGIGRYRTTEAGQPIDASGTIAVLDKETFNGPADLASKLVAAPQVSQCFAAQLTAYVLGVAVSDALCIAPPSAYAASSSPLSFSQVLGQVVEPTHLALRSP